MDLQLLRTRTTDSAWLPLAHEGVPLLTVAGGAFCWLRSVSGRGAGRQAVSTACLLAGGLAVRASLVVLRGICRGFAGLLLPHGSLEDHHGRDTWYFHARRESYSCQSTPDQTHGPRQLSASGDVHSGLRSHVGDYMLCFPDPAGVPCMCTPVAVPPAVCSCHGVCLAHALMPVYPGQINSACVLRLNLLDESYLHHL